MKSYKILCVGPQWRGSNAGGLFRALSKTGQLISVVDENYYINLSNKITRTRLLDKLFRKWHMAEFNEAILSEAISFQPDIVLVYKGAFVFPDTLTQLKKRKIKLINFYPDVSFKTHGKLLQKTLPLYDQVFTTKTFGLQDMKDQLGITSAAFIPHGFDPDIHRSLPDASEDLLKSFACDISFIGGWSEKKEKILSAVKKALPDVVLKIWGSRWENCKSPELQSSIQNRDILGDLYTLGILSSKINLGLLHEKVEGASSGDKITSRTFHIPGAGGFMIHERTDEIVKYFHEGDEIVLYSTEQELIDQITFYLGNTTDRIKIAARGHQRALNDHSLQERARFLLSKIETIF